jgi:hypothetical protein
MIKKVPMSKKTGERFQVYIRTIAIHRPSCLFPCYPLSLLINTILIFRFCK